MRERKGEERAGAGVRARVRERGEGKGGGEGRTLRESAFLRGVTDKVAGAVMSWVMSLMTPRPHPVTCRSPAPCP